MLDDKTPEDRARDILNALKSRGLSVGRGPELRCRQVYQGQISHEPRVLVAVHGIFAEEFRRFERHELEDHVVYVGLRRGRVSRELIALARRAADVPAANYHSECLARELERSESR
jgi:hypothetical protein